MKSFEQATGVKMVPALDSHETMGPAGDACHMQITSGKGGLPNRTKKMNPGGGYMVTSPDPTPKITSK